MALTAGSVPAKVLALTEGVMKAMLLTKLKITVCAAALMLLAGVGASGLTYRATAEQPRNAPVPTRTSQSRPQADDLEALRLEIEALRKSLQATRERVKTLESEVSALKGKSGGPAGMPGPGQPTQGSVPGAQPGLGETAEPRKGPFNFPLVGTAFLLPADTVSELEDAVKRLRNDPKDKQAAEALERALKRLKEREKPKPPADGNFQRP
jgi:hypothetical protein